MSRTYILLFSKGGAFMCIMNEIKAFVANGKRTFNDAAKRRYSMQTDDVIELRKEIFGRVTSRNDDLKALQHDRRNISADIRIAFDKLVLNNGQAAN